MQRPIFVDTNIFLRYLTKDDLKKARRCLNLFERADKKQVTLITSEAVLAEVVYVLSSKKLYNLSHEAVRDLLLPIITLKGLKIDHRQIFILALEIFAQNNIDFEDCLTTAYLRSQGLSKIYSYDMDFDKFDDIERLEP
jgi:predicted nucleic acid-binding protein